MTTRMMHDPSVFKSGNILHISTVTSSARVQTIRGAARGGVHSSFSPFCLSHWLSFGHFLSFLSTRCRVVAQLFATTFSVNSPTCFQIAIFHPGQRSSSVRLFVQRTLQIKKPSVYSLLLSSVLRWTFLISGKFIDRLGYHW